MNRLAGIVALALLAPPVAAQVVVQGTVSNESGRPLEQALVTLDPQGASRQVRTNADGSFSFLGVAPGQHMVRVLRVGFSPQTTDVSVTNENVIVDFTLKRVQLLDTVAVISKRTGLYGSVISSDSLKPVAGARVEVIGARKADSTNSSGSFNFPELKGGSYIVRVRHPLFDSRNFTVVVPVNGGTEMDVVVQPGRVSDRHMEMLYREMDTRLTFRGVNSAFVTREELKGKEKSALDQALRSSPEFSRKSLYIASDVCVFVDGVARPGAMIRDFAAEDIESVELYGAPQGAARSNPARALREADPSRSLSDRWPPRTPCGMPPTPNELRSGWAEVKVMFAVIWLKR
jgi:hypothetical protein